MSLRNNNNLQVLIPSRRRECVDCNQRVTTKSKKSQVDTMKTTTQKDQFGTKIMSTSASSSCTPKCRIGSKHHHRHHLPKMPKMLPSRTPKMVSLVNKGVKQMKRHQYEEAQISLQRALQMIDPTTRKDGTFSLESTTTADSANVDKSLSPNESTKPERIDTDDSSRYYALSSTANKIVNKSDTTMLKGGLNSNQRYEYDEGMDWGCRNPLTLDDISSVEGKCCAYGTILFNLGRISHNQKQYDDAERLYNQAMKAINDSGSPLTSGTNAMITFTVLFGIANLQYVRSSRDESYETYKRCLSIARSEFGPDSLQVAACLNCIGVTQYTRSNGNFEAALQALQLSLQLQHENQSSTSVDENGEVVEEEDSIDIGTTYNNIGRIYFQQKQYDHAMEAYRESLRIRLAHEGESVDCGAIYFNMAQVYHQRGDTLDALHFYKEFLRVANKNFGPWHRDICIVLTCIGQVLQERKEYNRATRAFHKALAVGRVALGPIHAEIAVTLNKLGNLYYEIGDFSAALNTYQHGLTVELAVLEPDDRNIRVTYTNIAEIHKQRNEFDQALENYERTLRLQREFNCDSLEIANTLSSIGTSFEFAFFLRGHICSCILLTRQSSACFSGYVCIQTNNLTRSLETNQECLRLRREIKGDVDEDVANTLTHLAMVFVKMDARYFALEVLAEAYRVRKALKSDSRDIAFILYQMGLIHHTSGSHDLALGYYLETAKMEKQALGKAHQDLSITYYNIAQIYFQRGELDVALQNFEEALKIEVSFAHAQIG